MQPPTSPAPALAHPTAPPAAPAVRFHQLDGLRAVAVLLVIAHHSITGGLVEMAAGARWRPAADVLHELSRSGVDLFFVLSGVVLLRPYLRARRPFNTLTYLRRRAERLWPAFLAAWLLAGPVLLLIHKSPTWWTARYPWPTFSVNGWLAQLPIVNLGWESYNAAWWSLTVELLFYLTVVLLIPLLAGRSRPHVAAAALVLLSVPVSLAIAMTGGPAHVPAPFLDLLRYSPCFALGVLLAAADLPVALAACALPAGVLWGIAAVAFPALNIHLGWALAYAALIALVLRPDGRGGVIGRLLARPLPVWLGERSYSLFLTHFAVFNAVNVLLSRVMPPGGKFLVVSRLADYAAALAVAMLVFQLVERRFARGLVTAHQIWPPLFTPRPPHSPH